MIAPDDTRSSELTDTLLAFRILAFPDISLPHYTDLLGGQALSVAASRLFSWLQLLATSLSRFSLILRYRYEPNPRSGRQTDRLQLFLLVRVPTAMAETVVKGGRSIIGTIMPLELISLGEAALSDEYLRTLWFLLRRESFYPRPEVNTFYYVRERWRRTARSRNALEPFLDEVFASIDTPAFLDIQIRPSPGGPAVAALAATIAELDSNRGAQNSEYAEFLRESYRGLLAGC